MLKLNDDNTMVLSAEVKSAYHQTKADKDGNNIKKNVVTFYPEDKEVFEKLEPVFKNVGKKFTPSWFKTKEHMIVRSNYDIPVKSTDGKELTFNEWLEDGQIKKAKITIKVLLKTDETGEYSGVIYPICVVVNEDGESFNPFEGM